MSSIESWEKKSILGEAEVFLHVYTQSYEYKDVYCSIISIMNWKQLMLSIKGLVK